MGAAPQRASRRREGRRSCCEAAGTGLVGSERLRGTIGYKLPIAKRRSSRIDSRCAGMKFNQNSVPRAHRLHR